MDILIKEPFFWGFILVILGLLSPFIVGTISMIKVLKQEDPENFNFKAVWNANFSADKRQFRKKVDQLKAEYPAVNNFARLGYTVTKFDTAIVIDERYQKWICIYNEKMSALSFSEISGTEAIEDNGKISVLIYTANESFPEIRIEVCDSDTSERLMKTVNDMRLYFQNNIYK